MGVLKKTLAGKVDFEVKSIHDDDAKGLQEKYFPKSQHGLLAFGKDGKLVGKIEGHRFGQAEMMAMAEKCMK